MVGGGGGGGGLFTGALPRMLLQKSSLFPAFSCSIQRATRSRSIVGGCISPACGASVLNHQTPHAAAPCRLPARSPTNRPPTSPRTRGLPPAAHTPSPCPLWPSAVASTPAHPILTTSNKLRPTNGEAGICLRAGKGGGARTMCKPETAPFCRCLMAVCCSIPSSVSPPAGAPPKQRAGEARRPPPSRGRRP